MQIRPPVLYDLQRQQVALLERTLNVSYSKKHNTMSTATITLAGDDFKNNLMQPMYYVEIFDNGVRVGLFRIMPKEAHKDYANNTITYELEHVISTLFDSVLFGYHEVGGVGYYTPEVLQYLLDQQNEPHWTLGQVDFNRQFQYSWENENVIAALLSVPRPFDTPYSWDFNTLTYPWVVNLREQTDELVGEIRYRANMSGITKKVDPTNLCTRMYALGFGEGINQLGISDVNPTGLPYIDSPKISKYGTITRIWVDRRYEVAETLFETAKKMLKELEEPLVEYTVDAINLFHLTGRAEHKLEAGNRIRVIDYDMGVDHEAYIVEVSRSNVFHDRGEVQVVLSNQPPSIAGTVADLANRVRINEVYSQGATSIDSHQLADNCDPNYPIRIDFHIPNEAVHINKVLLNYRTSAFRAYSKGAEAGGAATQTTSSGGSSTPTTSSGGSSTQTSSSGGGQTSSASGGHSHSVSSTTSSSIGHHRHNFSGSGTTTYAGSHAHTTDLDTNIATGTTSGHSHTYHRRKRNSNSGGRHNHSVSVGGATQTDGGAHSHSVSGQTAQSVSNHTHSVSNHTHSVSIPNHTHSVSIPNHSHSVTFPGHVHGIEHGIFLGGSPSAVTVSVDGNVVPGLGLWEQEVNITDYLDTTQGVQGGGRIRRGWHYVEITPNSLARVQGTIHIQQFIQSRGAIQM